jgi:hypothetical protein
LDPAGIGRAGQAIKRMNPTAYSIISFDQQNLKTGISQKRCCMKPCQSSSNDNHIGISAG